ncbi:VOC family protein [Pseudomonas sp. PA27(2017)]|uniref:VOC family protein n=1 Tax=Pseudomonas sp. PA27(2017) TaxID=1932112 RepID=UPI00096010D3|nr:VOC family protein [Pseudomonas sp. PA27(2017)]OLU33793.1 hypothetical protein BVH06_07460 [Pseudomonas sp. PA27(2017)]
MTPGTSPSNCSHVLLWVRDLHQAVEDFRQQGFEVTYATPKRSAQHAHIWFTHGPIIELLTTPANARWFKWPIDLLAGRGAGRRMLRWPAQGEGLCDLALCCDDQQLPQRLSELRQHGVAMGRVVNWRRTCEDGRQTRFAFVYPRNDRLPFLVTPYRPAQHPDRITHSNGATGLATIHLGVSLHDRHAVQRLVADDPLIQLHSATHTGLLGVEIDGLDRALDDERLHGARLLPASPSKASGERHA